MISAKRQEKIMGGVGSGDWYWFDKKTTTGECHSVDVRYFHRQGLLKSGHWFSLRWPRDGTRERETGASDPDIPPPEWSRRRMGRGKGARAPELDGLQLRWREALVRLSWCGMRPQGRGSVRAGALLP